MANLTDRQYLELAKLSYLYEGAFTAVQDETRTNTPTLEVFAKVLLGTKNESNTEEDTDTDTVKDPIPLVAPGKTENGYMSDVDFRDTLRFIQNDPLLSRLVLLKYFNDNANTGFVGFVLKDGADNRYFAYTGTEGPIDMEKEIDWNDNKQYLLYAESPQFEKAVKFAERYMTKNGMNYFTGHSKGGLNAMYAVAKLKSYNVYGVTFDALGQNRFDHLDPSEEKFMIENTRNYASYNDITGNAFPYPENTILVDMLDEFKTGGKSISEHNAFARFSRGHFLPAFKMDNRGRVMPNPNRDFRGLFASAVTQSSLTSVLDFCLRAAKLREDFLSGLRNELSERLNKTDAINRDFELAVKELIQRHFERFGYSFEDISVEWSEFIRKGQETDRDFGMAVQNTFQRRLEQISGSIAEMIKNWSEHDHQNPAIERAFYMAVVALLQGHQEQFGDSLVEMLNEWLELDHKEQVMERVFHIAESVFSGLANLHGEMASISGEYLRKKQEILGDFCMEVFHFAQGALIPFASVIDELAAERREHGRKIQAIDEDLKLAVGDLLQWGLTRLRGMKSSIVGLKEQSQEENRGPSLISRLPDSAPVPVPFGGPDSDILFGDRSTPAMRGYEGSDTYVLYEGHGHTSILDTSDANGVIFKNISQTAAIFRRSGDDLCIFTRFGNGMGVDDIVVIHGFFKDDAQVWSIQFADGSPMTRGKIEKLLLPDITFGMDYLPELSPQIAPQSAPVPTPAPLETLDTDPFADIAAANLDPSDPEDFAELAKRFNHGMSLSVVKALIELDAEILDNPIKIEEKMDVPATYNTPAHRIRRTTYVNPADRSVTSTAWSVV